MAMNLEQKRALALAKARLRLKQKSGPAPGAAESVAMGVTDPAFGLTQFLTRWIPQSLIDGLSQSMDETQGTGRAIPVKESGTVTPEKFDQQLQGLEADYQRRRGPDAGIDWGRLAGNVAALAPAGALMPASAPTVLGTVGRGAVSGAAMSLAQPVYGDNYAREKAKQIGAGAATGGVFAGGTQALGKAIAPKVSDAVQSLRSRGVTPRPGQIIGPTASKLEDAMGSINPAVGAGQRRAIEQFNRAAYNEVLSSVGERVPKNVQTGRSAIKWVGDKLSQKYDDLVGQLKFVPDERLTADISNLQQMAKELPRKEARFFDRFVKDTVRKALGPNGQMDGRTFKELQSKIGNQASRAQKSTDIYQQKLGDALDELKGAFEEALERSNPSKSADLKAINAAWAKLIPIENAAKATGSGGVFTPAQLLGGVRQASSTVRKRGFARGTGGAMQNLGEAGQEVLGNTYPDSGTAMRTLAGMGLLGGAAYVNPLAAGAVGASMLGYTPTGQRALAALLASRPAGAAPVRRLLERSAVPAGGLLGFSAAAGN